MIYDSQNIFAKMLRGDIACQKVFEDDYVLAFHDLHPKAPVHVLIIPKGPYVNFIDFSTRANADDIAGFFKGLAHVATLLKLEEPGCRILSNCGVNGGQEVPHFHVHLFGGKALGAMLS